MAVTYFGHNVNGADAQSAGTYHWWNDPAQIAYTCPGSGKQDVKELGCQVLDISSGNVRMAIYTTGGAFVTQGAAEVAMTGHASRDWIGHTSFVDQSGTPHSPQLDGGTDYILAISADGGGSSYVYDDTVTSGYMERDDGEKTGGFPATIASSGAGTYQFCVRCGVEAAAAGSSTASIVAAYSMRRHG